MSLYVALNNALTGLNVNQRQLSILSQNISNANTEGYSKQTGNQSAVTIDGVGSGVRIDDVTRKIDLYLQRSIRSKTSDVGLYDTVNDYLERLQIMLGKPGDQDSIDAKVEGFFNSLQRLAESPEIPSRRTDTVNTGVLLAQSVNTLAVSINDLRYQADRDINEGVRFVNDQLKTLASLNGAISRARALSNPTASLEDQQDKAIRSVAEYMDVQAIVKENGQIYLYAPNGIPLVDDSLYQMKFTPISSSQVFTEDGPMGALEVYRADAQGNIYNNELPFTVSTSAKSSEVTTVLSSGKFKALLDIRDNIFPDTMQQLDMLAGTLRDQINALHNSGSGYPGANSFTGTRLVTATEAFEWSGKARIAILDKNGNAYPSFYPDETETGGQRPLTIDFTKLNSGQGLGKPTVQTIIDEINSHFGSPQPKATLGQLNGITLVSNTNVIPSGTNTIDFDFEMENLGRTNSDFWVTGLNVIDNLGAPMGASTLNIPQQQLSPLNTYTTFTNSNTVQISTLFPHNYSNGQTIYLSTPPGGPYNGIPNTDLGGFFTIDNVTANTFTINVATQSGAAPASASVANQASYSKYDTINAGDKSRTNDQGTISADVSVNPFALYYDVTANVATKDDSGNIITSTITYRIQNNQTNKLNDRFGPTQVTGSGAFVTASTNQTFMRAILVDANGVEIGKSNGNYIDQPGYLKLVGGTTDIFISMDELDSKQLGLPSDVPPVAGTNRGFSHFFELNNFFKSNASTSTGDTLANSAINFEVESRIVSNNNLLSTGTLTRSNQPSDTTKPPKWTYQRFAGDNDLAQRLARLGIDTISFAEAGGLPNSSVSFNGYAGQMLGYAAANATSAEVSKSDNNTLLNGFNERSSAISGVNVDEELANTVIYQNAYAASARIISVVNTMFDELVNILQ